jgi:sulfatase modifying factor 1
MKMHRPWSQPPMRGRRSWLTLERVILVLFAAGTWMRQDTRTRNAALIPPRSERGGEPRHAWHLVDGRSWQIEGTASEGEPEARVEDEGTGACSRGMIEVAGRMKVERPGTEPIEELQNTTCTTWLQREFPERCGKFDEEQWRTLSAPLPTTEMRFCIDRFEYPNVRGEFPIIMVSWREAQTLCASNGKRLCTEAEWTFACEGEDARPYPYGYERDANACDIDRAWIPYHEVALRDRSSEETMRELDSLWQGTSSGASPGCRSPFGVYDMTGNVDEWTVSTRREGLPSIFKGGYWGPVRARCRASTRVHDPDFVFYQQGFRCCSADSDADGGPSAPEGDAD